ncbi:MAG: hypothetical protein IK088_08595, partial [Lachnospiraceae bacterium]|nr:hypothetical protein [Lachnospiraceae bacterium]
MAATNKAENTSLMVKDLILDGEEMERINSRKKKPEIRKSSYMVTIQSGCDFAVERRDQGKRTVTRLVVLVSQLQYYIEKGTEREALTKKSLKAFLSGLPKGEYIMLPDVNWIDRLENNKNFCGLFMDIVQEDRICCGFNVILPSRNEMMHQGLYYFDGGKRIFRGYFGEERITDTPRSLTCDYAPREGYGAIYERFGNPQENVGLDNGGAMEDPFAAQPPFHAGNALNGDYLSDPVFRVRLFGGFNPPVSVRSGVSVLRHLSYDEFETVMYSLSAPLYKYMLRIMTKRRNITNKELLRDVIPDLETKESMLFQSFVSFVMISYVFGIEAAK